MKQATQTFLIIVLILSNLASWNRLSQSEQNFEWLEKRVELLNDLNSSDIQQCWSDYDELKSRINSADERLNQAVESLSIQQRNIHSIAYIQGSEGVLQ